ncbi:MAG TPA: ketoacyl-ACP synthase III [Candidatus Avacidaminococcus intestinavium]|uniref:Beta-ketoacyl-[acyl-carrier-protein] synthase III n=1 Tax=Candidatus Avacidaminococcus intestinavium TaxID=2840684 RepID=A0A9D1MP16_9FIRM|nr:ketoacyl-ACP synthase III [Candidatus Avacidaminococcus intestinavium]
MSAGIIGMGHYLPEKIITNFDLEKMVDTNNEWIVERTGIEARHIAAPEEATSDLAYAAAVKAIADAGLESAQIECIIVASESPDTKFPSTACLLQAKLGAKKAAAFDLSAGCSGFVYALGVANSMITSGLYKYVLVVGAETLSRIMNWKDRNTCVLFGDGAGAAVLGPVEDGNGIIAVEMGADGNGGSSLSQPAGGSRKPASHETVDAGEHFIHMDGSEVFKFAITIMGKTAKSVLKKAEMTSDDVDLLVPHQANIRIINSAAKRLGLPMEKVFVNVEKYGNTSAASIPIALCEAREQGLLKKGKNILLVGFGAGLTWASIILKWNK